MTLHVNREKYMSQLSMRAITFWGLVDHCIHDWISQFSHDFFYGKSYLLDAELGKGAWALSWIIGGLLNPVHGEILKDGTPFNQNERLKEAWFVRKSEFIGFRAGRRSVKAYVQQGLKKARKPYLQSEQEIIERFYLTPERYGRSVRQLSHEGWRASCAIGIAQEKKIFCFPYIEYVRPYLVEEYYDSWLKPVVDLLRDSGALVLIPAIATPLTEKLCDEVVHIRRPYDAISPGAKKDKPDAQ